MALPPMPAALGISPFPMARFPMPTGGNPSAAAAAASSAPVKFPKKEALLGATGTGRGSSMGGGAGAGFSLTTPALTKNSSRVISPSVDCRWGCCLPPSAPSSGSSRTRLRHTSSTVLALSVRGSVSDEPWRCSGVGSAPPPAPTPAVEAEAMAWVSSAVQMLRSSSSMFMEPKSFPTPPPELAPPSALWNSSNVSE
uniref:Uncharacterized protein n=1 Tax=Arundo donax TaxID=35708 RepID=A0A0A9DA66_ARUDO